MQKTKDEIHKYCISSRKEITDIFHHNLDKYSLDYGAVPEDVAKVFAQDYEAMKKGLFVKSLIGIADQLYVYRDNFKDISQLRHNFIYDIPGVEWMPFPFKFDVKEFVYSESITKSSIEFILVILHKSYEFTYAIYDKIRAPDIDIDQFIEIINASIDKIQKQPELNRCHKAFSKIKDSINMLKTNFNEYYRDFVETQDNTIIMQNFIIDVSKNTKADPELTRQFRKIIAYYQELSKNNAGNTKNNESINLLYEKMNNTFKEYDMNFENIGIKENKSYDDSSTTVEDATNTNNTK
jgi:hypothetical protein